MHLRILAYGLSIWKSLQFISQRLSISLYIGYYIGEYIADIGFDRFLFRLTDKLSVLPTVTYVLL